MKMCDVCGEPIAETAAQCPFCETPQQPARARPPGAPGMVDINLEEGLPTVDEALARLDRLFAGAAARGVPLLRIIHGRGRGGGDAPIRRACRARLGAWARQGKIRAFHVGEDYHPTISRDSRALQRRHPVLTASEPADRQNAGITFVEV